MLHDQENVVGGLGKAVLCYVVSWSLIFAADCALKR